MYVALIRVVLFVIYIHRKARNALRFFWFIIESKKCLTTLGKKIHLLKIISKTNIIAPAKTGFQLLWFSCFYVRDTSYFSYYHLILLLRRGLLSSCPRLWRHLTTCHMDWPIIYRNHFYFHYQDSYSSVRSILFHFLHSLKYTGGLAMHIGTLAPNTG